MQVNWGARRLHTRSMSTKIDSRLQTILASPYARPQLQHAGLINSRGNFVSRHESLQSIQSQKRPRRDEDLCTPEAVLRALKEDEHRRSSRYRQSIVAARRASFNHPELLDRRHRKQSQGSDKSRERNVSIHTTVLEQQDTPRNPVSRVHSGGNRSDKQPNVVSHDSSNMLTNERAPCEITMTFGSAAIVHGLNAVRYEVLVMQQHGVSENQVVYRGYLAEGETFSFQIQRSSISPLALVFYAKGYIDSVVNECCEYRFDRRHRRKQEHGHFLIKEVRHATLCDKCRAKRHRRILSTSQANTSSFNTETHGKRTLGGVHSFDDHGTYATRAYSCREDKKDKRIRRHRSVATGTCSPGRRPEPVDFQLLELALIDEANSSSQLPAMSPIHTSAVHEHTPNQSVRSIQNSDEVHNKSQQGSVSILQHPQSTTAVENFVYVLDGAIRTSNHDYRKLRGLINSGWLLDGANAGACLDHIAETVPEKIIMLVSRATLTELQSHIQDISQLLYIYVVDDSKDRSYDFEKVRGIYSSVGKACRQLEKDLVPLSYDLTPVLPISLHDASNGKFAYLQLLTEILVEADDAGESRREMLDFCRQAYADNGIQLRFIDEFERSFQPSDAAKWYTRSETFLCKMLGRAFRALDAHILFKLRFFLQHLHRQAEPNRSSGTTTVYRAQYISNDVLETMSQSSDGFVAFAPFVLAQKTKRVSQQQQQRAERPLVNPSATLVLVQMKLDACISTIRTGLGDDEILLPAATAFRLSSIKRKDGHMPVVKLIINNDVLNAVHEATANVRSVVQGSFPLLRLAKLMKQTKDTHLLEHFCAMLIDHPSTVNDPTANLTVGSLLHTLCSLYYEQDQLDRALDALQKSLGVYLRVLQPDDVKLTPTYNNMGSIYYRQGRSEHALHCHRKAYDIQVLSAQSNFDSIAVYAGNVAAILVQQGKYAEAVPYLQRDLQIRQRLHPDGNDLELSTKYHNLAGALFRSNEPSRALENYEKCLDIELKLRPANHPTVAVTYYSMATVQDALGRPNEAIDSMSKAIERLLLTRSNNDEQVRLYREYKAYLEENADEVPSVNVFPSFCINKSTD